MVNPEIIICDGLPVLNACFKMGAFNPLEENRVYGNIYNVTTALGQKVKTIAIYELSRVLIKEGEQYEDTKRTLYMQLKNAFDAIGGI